MNLLFSKTSFRTWRRTSAFKQKEIAILLGLKDTTHVSRMENGRRVPNLQLAMALEVLTGKSLHALFAEQYEAVEEETLARVTTMLMAIENHSSLASHSKRQCLKGCQDRVITRHKQKHSYAETKEPWA